MQERVRISTAVSAAIVITVAVVGACILTALTLSESYSEHAGTALSSIPSAYFRLAASERKPSFSPSDAEFLRENVEGIDRVALARLISGANFIIGFDPLTGELVDPTVSLKSVESSYFPIRNLQLAAGRFFDSADGDARVVVIGASVAEQLGLRLGDLFHYREVVGAFEVVGVLQPVEEVRSIWSSSKTLLSSGLRSRKGTMHRMWLSPRSKLCLCLAFSHVERKAW